MSFLIQPAKQIARGAAVAAATLIVAPNLPTAVIAGAAKIHALIGTGWLAAGHGISAAWAFSVSSGAKLATWTFIKYTVASMAYPTAAPIVAIALGVLILALVTYGAIKGVRKYHPSLANLKAAVLFLPKTVADIAGFIPPAPTHA